MWDGQNFSQSAENVQFNIEAGGQAAVLRASLSDSQGNREARDINLGERISNNNGSFAYSMRDSPDERGATMLMFYQTSRCPLAWGRHHAWQ